MKRRNMPHRGDLCKEVRWGLSHWRCFNVQGLRRVAPSPQLRKLAQQPQAVPLALFGMELRDVDMIAPDHGSEHTAKARKFRDLQATNDAEEIASLAPIDRVPRMLQAPELTDGLPFADAELEEVEDSK